MKLTSYEGYFSFKDYLLKKGVDSEIKASSIEVKFERPLRLASIENAFINRFDDPITQGLLSSLLFNNKDYSNEAILLASSMNALNFLSTSGLLLGAILHFLDWLFALKYDEKKTATIVFALSLFLFPFGIRKVGYWRVIIYRFISMICIHKNKEIDPLTKVSLVGSLLFLINPYNALNSGYLIGFGLSIFMQITSSHRSRFERNEKKAIDYLYLMLFLWPLFVKRNAFHPLSPIYSFIMMPLILPFAMLGYASFASLPFVSVLKLYSSFLLWVLRLLSSLDYALPIGEFNDLVLFIYYYSLALFFSLRDIGLTAHSNVISILGIITLALRINPLLNIGLDQVVFLNVGQGDCIFIRNNTKTVMIDTGGNTSFDIAKEVLIPFFRKERVSKLDYLIISHDDTDHSGGVDSLKSNFKIRNIIRKHESFPITIGDIKLTSYNEGGFGEKNDDSLVLSLDFMGKKWLFTGDASVKTEKEIIKNHPSLRCDVLKVGHHGSDTSTSEEFLDLIKPSEAVISVGEGNKFKHPNDSVLHKLMLRNIKIRRTDLEGSIYYTSYLGFLKNYR
ncbi:MAG: ComEC/Rec2 family competence protein [Bacilli bacterium]|nr:ComEC/Rec2 family competence protein [Bacilli bacterium]